MAPADSNRRAHLDRHAWRDDLHGSRMTSSRCHAGTCALDASGNARNLGRGRACARIVDFAGRRALEWLDAAFSWRWSDASWHRCNRVVSEAFDHESRRFARRQAVRCSAGPRRRCANATLPHTGCCTPDSTTVLSRCRAEDCAFVTERRRALIGWHVP